jgi:hypothetical protein
MENSRKTRKQRILSILPAVLFTLALGAYPNIGYPDESHQDLAKKLSNPVADLIMVPLQGNYDGGIGPKDQGQRYYVNVEPVIPIFIGTDWNMISRTVLPVVIQQKDIFPGAGTQSGLGDTTQSLFFSPKKPTSGGLIWGLGPVFLLPTGTDDLLGSRKWGAGPTGVVLTQKGPWSLGLLANQIWSFAGDSNRSDVNAVQAEKTCGVALRNFSNQEAKKLARIG